MSFSLSNYSLYTSTSSFNLLSLRRVTMSSNSIAHHLVSPLPGPDIPSGSQECLTLSPTLGTYSRLTNYLQHNTTHAHAIKPFSCYHTPHILLRTPTCPARRLTHTHSHAPLITRPHSYSLFHIQHKSLPQHTSTSLLINMKRISLTRVGVTHPHHTAPPGTGQPSPPLPHT